MPGFVFYRATIERLRVGIIKFKTAYPGFIVGNSFNNTQGKSCSSLCPRLSRSVLKITPVNEAGGNRNREKILSVYGAL